MVDVEHVLGAPVLDLLAVASGFGPRDVVGESAHIEGTLRALFFNAPRFEVGTFLRSRRTFGLVPGQPRDGGVQGAAAVRWL